MEAKEEVSYRDQFDIWCVLDILDAHEYRNEVIENLGGRLYGI